MRYALLTSLKVGTTLLSNFVRMERKILRKCEVVELQKTLTTFGLKKIIV